MVAEIALIAHGDGEALAAFHILRNVRSADLRCDDLLHVGHREAVARGFGPVHLNIQIESLRNALRKDRVGFRHGGKNLLHARSNIFDVRQIGALNLDPHRGLDAGQFHVEPVLDRHGPRIGEARKLELLIHVVDQLFVSHAGTPLVARLEHDGGVVHIERCVVRGAVGAAHGAEHRRRLQEMSG